MKWWFKASHMFDLFFDDLIFKFDFRGGAMQGSSFFQDLIIFQIAVICKWGQVEIKYLWKSFFWCLKFFQLVRWLVFWFQAASLTGRALEIFGESQGFQDFFNSISQGLCNIIFKMCSLKCLIPFMYYERIDVSLVVSSISDTCNRAMFTDVFKNCTRVVRKCFVS